MPRNFKPAVGEAYAAYGIPEGVKLGYYLVSDRHAAAPALSTSARLRSSTSPVLEDMCLGPKKSRTPSLFAEASISCSGDGTDDRLRPQDPSKDCSSH